MTHWFHPRCAAFKRPEPLLETLATLTDVFDDQVELEHEARLGVTHRRVPRVDSASRAPSGRAACRACKAVIEKNTWRIGLVFYEDGRFAPSGYIHLACAAAYLETTELLPRLREFSPDLAEADFADIQRALSSDAEGR